MVLSDLIGKQVEDIRVKIEYESYGLDRADSFVILRDNLIIGIPWSLDVDAEVWERDLDKEAKSIFVDEKNEAINSIKGKKIIDLLEYNESVNGFAEAEKVVIELEGEKFIAEITMAPNGTGHAGLWVFKSKEALVKRYGNDFKRLSDDKASA